MLEPKCPHCSQHIALLGPAWQSQRASLHKLCPFCGKSVVPQFKGSIYIAWFAALLAASLLAYFAFGPYGFAPLFVAAILAPLVPSIYLHNGA